MASNADHGMATALIYAELLSNIRQVSVIVSLDTPSTRDTRASLSADGASITLIRNGVSTSLELPAPVQNSTALPQIPLGSKEASWRLPLRDQTVKRVDEFGQDNVAPWSASSLPVGASFVCRGCKSLIIRPEVIQEWRDLPSENWAEMMDFWHCHKPHGPHDAKNGVNGEELAQRGYGANTKFIARPGIGFVDLTYFLLADSDCMNLTVRYPWLFSFPSSSRPFSLPILSIWV
jgi:hypothetical protein